MTEDSRPYVRDNNHDDELAFWMPDPPRDGDAVYCCGARIGTFRGENTQTINQIDWYVETIPTKDMPAKLAAHVREKNAE